MAFGVSKTMFEYITLVAWCMHIVLPSASQLIRDLYLDEERGGGTVVADIINEARLYEQYTVNELSNLRFQILTQTDVVSQYFRIPVNTSNLVTRDKIDRDTLCAYHDTCDIYLDIGMQANQNLEIFKFVIHIQDINDNVPVFLEDTISLSIPESAVVGSSFDLPAAEDADAGNFSIQEYGLLSFQDIFELRVTPNPDGTHRVSLVLKETLDREIRNSYTLTLVAKDGGNPMETGSAIVQINVLDSNDNNPEFENDEYEVYMSENNEIASPVIQVRAHDPDEGPSGEIEYDFTRQTQTVYGHLFQINSLTGVITTTDVIDYEQHQQFNLRIVARDKGPSGLTGFTQVVIIVRDLNDNAPVITVHALSPNEQVQVQENQDPDQFVAHVSVSDPDGGENGEVTCTIDNNSKFNLVQMYATEFQITSAVVFDREEVSEYTVTMNCQDRGSSTQLSTQRIVVRITDVNDHAPIFSQDIYEVNVHENSGVGITVLQVNATDVDAGQNSALRFSLRHIGLYGSDILYIDPQSGIITTRVSLDYETHHEYSFYVTAQDNGSPTPKSATASLILNVVDTNDNAPTFSQTRFTFNVEENTPVNTVIGTVMAYDLDAPPYNQISYSLMSHGWDDLFSINPDTGNIWVTALLDREQMGVRQNFDLVAKATNNGYGLQNSVEVTIFVEDVNDNPPLIIYPTEQNHSVNVKSNAKIGRLVTSVQATDLDIGRNGLLSYRIVEFRSGHNLFSIDRHTGSIYVKKELDDFGNKEIELQIEVHDNADNPLAARTILNIYINKTDSPSEKQLVTNLTFVIAVVVTSVILVAVVVVVFVIFMLRRNQQMKKNTAVYSYKVEEKDDVSQDGEERLVSGIPTVSRSVAPKSTDSSWPDIIDVKQIAFHEKPYYDRHHYPNGNNYVNGISANKRVHFKDSLESVHSAARDSRSNSTHRGSAFLEDSSAQVHSGSKAPMFLDEGRHKLLYGADTKALQLTSHNLQTLYRGQDGDELSDQGSSVDSGRGPSEEEQDPQRSSGVHNRSSSLNDSRESGEPNRHMESNRQNRTNNYMDMNKARKHKLKAPNFMSALNNVKNHSKNVNSNNNRVAARLDSDSSFQSEPPLVPPRGTKPPVHPRTAVIHPQISSIKSQHNFPDLNVPAGGETPSSGLVKASSNTSIGKYNVRTASNAPRFHAPHKDSQRCEEHNVVDHFPELCQRTSIPLWVGRDYLEPDSRSDGGSTTSGSYMVDGSVDHMDLGPEISRDVFV